MTFLNSALLIGITAAALPILIHLFSKRRYPIIDFSSLRFLRKLQRQQMRKIQLRQWLLLLLRTLAILLIVLAFTRPTLTERLGGSLLSSGRTGSVIVIDASASMQAKSPGGSSFQKAKDAAQDLIEMMNPGDRASIILARQEPEPLTASLSAEGDILSKILEDAEPWDGSADITTAVHLALETLSLAQDFRSEIYIISDFCQPVELPPIPGQVAAHFVPVNANNPENVSVSNIEIISEIIEPGQPIDLKITLANHGIRDQNDIYYSIFLDGTRVGEDVITLAAGSEISRQHQILPDQAGLMHGLVQIEQSDALAVDNRGYYCLYVPEQIKILLVGDVSSTRETGLALTAGQEGDDLFVVEIADPQGWDTRQISQYDVIIFSNPIPLQQTQVARIVHFVQQGGGLFILPGDQIDIARLNRELLGKLNTPMYGEKIGGRDGNESFLTWQSPDLNSPLFKGIIRSGNQPSPPRFYQAISLMDYPGDAPVLFENGIPFLTESELGRGHVILCASSPQSDWSDWAQRGIFAPLLHRIVLRLARSSSDQCSMLHAGEDFQLTTNPSDGSTAEMIFPDGRVVSIPLSNTGQRTAFVHSAMNPTGIYRLQAGLNEYLTAINPPPTESELKPTDLYATHSGWIDTGAKLVTPDQLVETVRASRYGRELWKSA